MSNLRERAAEAQSGLREFVENAAQRDAGQDGGGEALPEITYDGPIEDIDTVPVDVAWVRVMRDVKSIDKRSEAKIDGRKQDGTPFSYKFNYRGIDKVLNAVGPALRRHGVRIVPTAIVPTYGNAGRMRECLVTVTYTVTGPAGDSFTVMGIGEGLDAGERATPKALTTAYRNMLIVALSIPTEDPKLDPDVADIQRESPRPPTPDEYAEEIQRSTTTMDRLHWLRRQFADHPEEASATVELLGGERITLGDLLTRVGRARQEGR